MQGEVLSWEGVVVEAMPSTGGAVLRQFISREQLTVARVAFDAGASIAEHSHENEQIAFILSGRMEFLIAGKPHLIEQGQMAYLPSGVLHSARALEASVLLDMFSPPRADWESAERD